MKTIFIFMCFVGLISSNAFAQLSERYLNGEFYLQERVESSLPLKDFSAALIGERIEISTEDAEVEKFEVEEPQDEEVLEEEDQSDKETKEKTESKETPAESQSIVITESNCLSGKLTVTYLQLIALVDKPKMVINLSPCNNDEEIAPAQLTYVLTEKQVPLTIEVECMSNSEITIGLFDHDKLKFTGVIPCEMVLNKEEVILEIVP